MDWNEILTSESEDDLKEMKLWLFQENIRLQNEKKELEESRERFIKERSQFRDEMNSLNHKIVIEQKRLKDENLFFDKKMQILQDGFRQLDEDRKNFAKDKQLFESRKYNEERNSSALRLGDASVSDILFKGVNNSLGLKKRYRDLIKIYHPDNICGDAKMVQIINREYELKRKD